MMIALVLITCITFILLPRFSTSWGWKLLCMKQSPEAPIKMKTQSSAVEDDGSPLLDLPEPILDAILERLPPDGLCKMGAVSTFLRKKCISDRFWSRHMDSKWGRIVGPAAYQEWQRLSPVRIDPIRVKKQNGLMYCVLHKLYQPRRARVQCPLPVDSILSRYLALQNGTLWFPAQIYNRQNGHVGFLLSCYDAKLSYDHQTDTFQARYPAHGMLDIPIEKNVTWERLRSPPAEARPCDLYDWDCLKELHPGDHIEIQWRRNKEFPYGWWYGLVGHMDSCDGNEANCHCSTDDIIVLEFNQYSLDSRWRKTLINRRDHRETGNDDDGFYGGIRRLHSRHEISTWLRLWPSQALEGV